MRKKSRKKPPRNRGKPYVFMVFYRLQPVWEEEYYKDWESFFDCVLHSLFDTHGEIDWIENGFQCIPDESHAGMPAITIDALNKVICFALCGFSEKDVGEAMQIAVEDFGNTFATNLEGMTVECWKYVKEKLPILIASRDISDQQAKNPNKPRFFNTKTGNA